MMCKRNIVFFLQQCCDSSELPPRFDDVLFPMKPSHLNRKQSAAAIAAALVSLGVSSQTTAQDLLPWMQPQTSHRNEMTSVYANTAPTLHPVSLSELTESTTDAASKLAREQIALTSIQM